MHDTRESDNGRVPQQPSHQAQLGLMEGGRKAVDQRKHVPIARSPDAEPGACVAWVGACALSNSTPDI
jgi:hypothetical protein